MVVKVADQSAAFGGMSAEGGVVGPSAADVHDQQRRMFLGRRVHLEDGIATGVEPTSPDPRIPLNAAPYQPTQRTPAELADSVVKAAFGVYYDSAKYAAEHPGRVSCLARA